MRTAGMSRGTRSRKGRGAEGREPRASGVKFWLVPCDGEERVLTIFHGNKIKRPSRERKLDERPDALADADDRLHLVRRVANEVGVPGDGTGREGGDDGRAAAWADEVSVRVEAMGRRRRKRTRTLCIGRYQRTTTAP